jgi:hypothetical protein
VLGWHVLRRHRQSRVALSVVAMPLFLSGIATGGFFSSLVAASALMLWSRPARDWFDGVATAPASAPVSEIVHPSGARHPGSKLPPYAGFGASAQPASTPAEDRGRPGRLVWACVLTWVFSSISVTAVAVSLVQMFAEGDAVIDRARAQNPDLETAGVSDQLLLAAAGVFLGVLITWALLAIVIAYFVWRGREWARIMLIISAALTAGLALFASILGPVTLPLLAAGGGVIWLLLTRQAAAWCRRPSSPSSPGSPSSPSA